ncbi:thioredoxin [Clostridium cavendishii DSM 21758]|uniref:Thioredoxin n=1 Tax=Clostridium cavendishii DSM 21758 TaxID=1121302 RepID=A0A1M6D679_9CLOT|nr:thioredoxin [Clostridium cavendishii]SHI68745.1 thioredoxin [Clostridium cavendishii DSM 21758]
MAKIINSVEFQNQILNKEGVVLVDFFAEWCGPCKMIAPILNELTTEVENKAKIYKVDIDKSGELADKYSIMSVPTMIIFKNGKPVEQIVGFQSKDTLKTKLEYYAN